MAAKRGPGNPAWIKGGRSPNPAGRGVSRVDSADVPMQTLATRKQEKLTRRDGWENQAGGHGTRRDRRTLTRYSADVVTDLEALVLWRTEFLAARIIEAWVEAAYRRGWSVKTDDEALGKKMRSWADDLGVEAAVVKAANYEAAYGGAAIFPVLEGAVGDISTPLDLETGSIETIKALHVLEPRELQPEEWYENLTDPGWQRPRLWRLSPLQGGRGGWAGMQRVHSSRLILWPGIQVSRQTQPGQREGWGDSVLCRPKGVIADFGLAWGSAATLLHQHGRSTLKKEGLKKMLGLADGLEEFDRHIAAMQMAWTTLRMNAIDANDDIVQSTGTLAGVSDTLSAFKSLMSAATEGIPLSVLFGESQTGLRSGDADNEGWDAKVEGRRNKRYRPPHEKILKLMFLSQDGPAGGEEPEVWSLEYPPLSAPTETELATIRKTNVEKAEMLIGNGVASADDIAESYYGTSPDGDVKGDVHINFERREAQAQAAQQMQGQLSPEDMAAMGYEPDDAELDGMAAQDQAVGDEWEGDDSELTQDDLDEIGSLADEFGVDHPGANAGSRDDSGEQRTDKGAYHGSGGSKGYNPNRDGDGKFGSGAHKERPKVGRDPAAAVATHALPHQTASGTTHHEAKAAIADAKAKAETARSHPSPKNLAEARTATARAYHMVGTDQVFRRPSFVTPGAAESALSSPEAKAVGVKGHTKSAPKAHTHEETEAAISGAAKEMKLHRQAVRDGDLSKAESHLSAAEKHAAVVLASRPEQAKERGTREFEAYARPTGARMGFAEEKARPSTPPEAGALKAAEYDRAADKFSAGLTKDQRFAIHNYTDHTDRIFNPMLRANGGHIPESTQLYEGSHAPADVHASRLAKRSAEQSANTSATHEMHHLDAAIASHTMDSDAKVYRTMSDPGGRVSASLKPGDSFIDHAYVSTTAQKSFLTDFYQSSGPTISGVHNADKDRVDMHIQIRKGAHAAPLANEAAGHKAAESEVLLPRGSKFRVTHIEEASEGRPKTVHLELDHNG